MAICNINIRYRNTALSDNLYGTPTSDARSVAIIKKVMNLSKLVCESESGAMLVYCNFRRYLW